MSGLIKCNLDIAPFSASIRELAKITHKETREVLDAECKAIFDTAINRTKIASRYLIERKSVYKLKAKSHYFLAKDDGIRLFSFDPTHTIESMMTPGGVKKGNQDWISDLTRNKSYSSHWRLPNAVWARVLLALKARQAWIDAYMKMIHEQIKAIGLSRQTWLTLAKYFNLYDAGKIKNLNLIEAAKGKKPLNPGSITKVDTGGVYGYNIQNTAGFALEHARAEQAMTGAIAGREVYFQKNMEHAVFTSTEQIKRAYPFLR